MPNTALNNYAKTTKHWLRRTVFARQVLCQSEISRLLNLTMAGAWLPIGFFSYVATRPPELCLRKLKRKNWGHESTSQQRILQPIGIRMNCKISRKRVKYNKFPDHVVYGRNGYIPFC